MNTVEFIARHFEIGAADRCLALSTLEGDISVMDIFVTLRTGGSIVVVDEAAAARSPMPGPDSSTLTKFTVLHFMPGWLEMLSEVGAGRLSSVRVIPTGGDWVRPELVRRLRAEAPAPALRPAWVALPKNRHPQHHFRDRRRRRTPHRS